MDNFPGTSLSRSVLTRFIVFSTLLFAIFTFSLSYHFFVIERSKYSALGEQIVSSLRESISVKDEVMIRARIIDLLQKSQFVAIELESEHFRPIREYAEDAPTDIKPNELGLIHLLFSRFVSIQQRHKIYSNRSETFLIRFTFGNSSRRDIFFSSFVATTATMFLVLLFFLIGSKSLIDRKMLQTSIDEEKSHLATRIFHLLRSDISQLLAIVNKSNGIERDNKLLIKSILLSIQNASGKFVKGSDAPQISKDSNEVFLLADFAEQTIARKRFEYPGKNFVVEYGDEHSEKIRIKTNYSELYQAISNLLNNANEATELDDTIRIRIHYKSDQHLVVFSVIDNGCGIPKTEQQKVFDVGYSFDKPSGNGLGLPQTKAILSNLGADILIRSVNGQGTEVKVFLVPFDIPEAMQWKENETIDFVLIDDSTVRRLNELQRAKRTGKRIATFSNVESFRDYERGNKLHRETPIVVDSDLGEETSGEEQAKVLFYEDGFKDITLFTADEESSFDKEGLPWIKKIYNKTTQTNISW